MNNFIKLKWSYDSDVINTITVFRSKNLLDVDNLPEPYDVIEVSEILEEYEYIDTNIEKDTRYSYILRVDADVPTYSQMIEVNSRYWEDNYVEMIDIFDNMLMHYQLSDFTSDVDMFSTYDGGYIMSEFKSPPMRTESHFGNSGNVSTYGWSDWSTSEFSLVKMSYYIITGYVSRDEFGYILTTSNPNKGWMRDWFSSGNGKIYVTSRNPIESHDGAISLEMTIEKDREFLAFIIHDWFAGKSYLHVYDGEYRSVSGERSLKDLSDSNVSGRLNFLSHPTADTTNTGNFMFSNIFMGQKDNFDDMDYVSGVVAWQLDKVHLLPDNNPYKKVRPNKNEI